MSLRSLIALLRKDLIRFFGDRRALIFSFALPIALASFMGFATGRSMSKVEARLAIAVADLDRSTGARAIVSALTSDKNLAVTEMPLAAAREAVRSGKALAAVVLPTGFVKDATSAFFRSDLHKPEVVVLTDPSHGAEAGMIRGILTEHVMEAVGQSAFGGGQPGIESIEEALADLKTKPDVSPEDRSALSHMLGSVLDYERQQAAKPPERQSAKTKRPGFNVPFETREEQVVAREGADYNGYAHAFAGMGVQFVLFAAIETGIGILEDRERGIWRRLRAAPLARGTLLMAKSAFGAVVACLILAALYAFGRLAFDIRIEGSLAGFVLVVAGFAAMSAAVGLLVASVGKTPKAARSVATFVVLVMVMLGGAWVPAFLFPPFLQHITLVMPTRWAVDGLEAMSWRGLSFSAALPAFGVLCAYAAAFGVLAVLRFRWDD